VFTSDRNGNLEIYVMNADGSGQTNLTNASTDEWNPAWSPNASKIAFSSDRNNPWVDSEIYVMNADGSGQTNLTQNPAWDDSADWSPNGFKIAFDSDRAGWPDSEIYVMNPDGSSQTNLSNNPAYDAEPAWSPDGSKISFTSDRDVSNLEIYVMNNDGTGQTNLTNFPGGNDFMSDWSKDGTKIAFTSDRDNGNYEIYAMNANGSGQTNLTQHIAADYDPDRGPEPIPLLYWKDYNGSEVPGGYMPDIDQNQDFDNVQIRTEEDDPSVSYPTGTWTTILDEEASGGSRNYADHPASCTFSFTGSSIKWITTKAYNRGMSEVWIDGNLMTTVDLYDPNVVNQVVLYSNSSLSSGLHTIQVKSTNTKNPSSQGYLTSNDAFDVDDNEKEYCAPVAEANSLWWLDKKYDLGLFDTDTHTEYVTDVNEDGSNDILDLVQELALLMGTNVGQTGTTVEGEQHGIDLFLTNHNLTNKLYEHTVTDNTVPEPYPDLFHYIKAEVERSQDVKLDLGFWHVDEAIPMGPGMWQVTWSRRGGHAVTVAGVDSQNFLLAISDPDNDAAENGGLGVIRPVPGGHLLHPNDPSVHNNEANASHDIYTVGPSPSPGGKMGLLNFPWKWNLPTGEWKTVGPVPVEWTEPLYESMTFTEIEAAVIVSPLPICGDGIIGNTPGETCDPPGVPGPNPLQPGNCRQSCTYCGDGLVNNAEACDDGNGIPGDGCENNCTLTPVCGNQIIEAGETCDPPGVPGPNPLQPGICRAAPAPACTYCGDGIPNNGEQCDDGNGIPGDGCENNCTNTPVCGNGILEPPVEECDDGNTNNGDGCSAACLLEIMVIQPNGGEVIASGSNYTIKWQNSSSSVKSDLQYSTNNGSTWTTIANDVPGTSYNWTVPSPIGNQTQCRVKVIGNNALGGSVGQDISNGPFTIEVVKLTSPNGGETWKSGTIHAITWTTNGTASTVAKCRLRYTKDGGTTWITIKTRPDNPGSYNWTVPPVAGVKKKCKVKVILFDSLGNQLGTDVSNSKFTITP
jgi:TolB protein